MMSGFSRWLVNNRELKNEELESAETPVDPSPNESAKPVQPEPATFARWAVSERGSRILAQKKAASDWNAYGADYDGWIDDVNAFGKNASNQTQSWKDAGTASALVAQNRESAAALKTRGQGIFNYFTNYADDIDATNGAGTAQRVLDSITSAQKGIDDTQSYVDYVTQGWATAPDAETYANYQSWTQNPRSSADVIKDIESANARISELKNKSSGYNKGIETPETSGPDWATPETSPRLRLDEQRNAAREATISAHDDLGAEEQRLATLREELKFRQNNETYEKQQRWKEGRRGVQAINVNLDTVNGNIADLEREEGRLAGVLNDLDGQKYDPGFDQAYYDRVKSQHDGLVKQIDELKTVQKDLSDELSYNKYLDREDERAEWAKYANNADFAEKSQYTPTGFGKEDINFAPKLDYVTALVLAGFDPVSAAAIYGGSKLLNPDDADRDREVTYGLVNRDAAAITQNLANKAPNEILLGQHPTDGIEYYQMSQDERATYNYLYATDKAKADEYMEWLYPQLTERQRDAETKAVHDWTQENAANAIVGNV
ncbi:MAG: hypothetical protein IIT84_03610, partial [Oscillospiraceae bacterium]|nr:hypothetical protein [Oscillospiraceae bacterium]